LPGGALRGRDELGGRLESVFPSLRERLQHCGIELVQNRLVGEVHEAARDQAKNTNSTPNPHRRRSSRNGTDLEEMGRLARDRVANRSVEVERSRLETSGCSSLHRDERRRKADVVQLDSQWRSGMHGHDVEHRAGIHVHVHLVRR
jgi:hypothetical protein